MDVPHIEEAWTTSVRDEYQEIGNWFLGRCGCAPWLGYNLGAGGVHRRDPIGGDALSMGWGCDGGTSSLCSPYSAQTRHSCIVP